MYNKVAWQAKSGWHTLTHGDVEINVVPEGGKARSSAPSTIPGPAQLGVAKGLGYATLPGWIELKLSSGRQRDHAHVVDVLKKTAPQMVQLARKHLSHVHHSYVALFDKLLATAKAEKSQERKRGRSQ